MLKKKWFNIAKSHREAQEFHDKLDAKMTPEERLNDITYCRKQYFIMKGLDPDNISIENYYKISKRNKV